MKDALIYWFTGLSGSGKTTIADATKTLLEADGYSVLILDGDNIRNRLHVDLGFSKEDIKNNNSLIIKLCQKIRKDNNIIFVSIISPYNSSRKDAEDTLKPGFYEVYCKADIQELISRDTKGLYSKALKGEINDLIGFSSTSIYEMPPKSDIILDTVKCNINESVNDFYNFVQDCLK